MFSPEPLIFETMTWDRNHDIVDQERYSTENDAIIGHDDALERQRQRVASENS